MTLKFLYSVMAVIGIFVLVMLIINTARINVRHRLLDQAVDDYISAQSDAMDMTQASDYLTEQVREFAATLDKTHMDNYFNEANVVKRRDKAVENIRQGIQTLGEDSIGYLEKSLELSNQLMITEFYAFRLGAESKGIAQSELPEEIRSVSLSAEDAALSAAEKQKKAVDLVYSLEYQEVKEGIYSNASKCSEKLMESIMLREMQNSKGLRFLLRLQYILIVVAICVIVFYLILTFRFVIQPIERFVQSIRNNEEFEHTGAQELSFMADSYNEMLSRTKEDQTKLSYEATHDALTGLYNRTAYEDLMKTHGKEDIAFIIVDVDRFKEFNDTYGHAVGDKVLQRVANVLCRSFRSEDYICRIGGDEFAIIMVNTDPSLGPLICTKLSRIADSLREEKDDVPAITLSIGVAFSERKDPQGTIFEDADRALYRAKERGKNTFEFY